MEQLVFHVLPDAGQVRLMEALLRKVFHLPRIVAGFVFFAAASSFIGFSSFKGEYTAPLLIFSLAFAVLYGLLLCYTLLRRPALLQAARRSQGRAAELVFSGDGFSVLREEGSCPRLTYGDVRGQYWCGDYYFLYVNATTCRELFCIPVTGETFDGLYELSSFLHKNKKPLTRVRLKAASKSRVRV